MAAKKKSLDAQKVDKFLDDLRQNMHDHSAPPALQKSALKELGVSFGGLMVQAILFGVAGGVGLRIVRFIAGF